MRVAVRSNNDVTPGSLVWAGHGYVDVSPRPGQHGLRAHFGATNAGRNDSMPLVKPAPPAAGDDGQGDVHCPLGVAFEVPVNSRAGKATHDYTAIAVAVAGIPTIVQRLGKDDWPIASTYPGCFLTILPEGHTKTTISRHSSSVALLMDVQLPALAPTHAQRQANQVHLRALLI
jgi:hypothetical protein